MSSLPLPRVRTKRNEMCPLQGPLTIRNWLEILDGAHLDAMRDWYAGRYGFDPETVTDAEAVEQVMRRYPGGVTGFAANLDGGRAA